MKHLEQYKLFILKKLLLEIKGSFRNYELVDFLYQIPNKKTDFSCKEVLKYLLKLEEDKFIKILNISIKRGFFENSLKDFIQVDFDRQDRPAYATVLTPSNYLGLGKDLFEKYEKECCSGSISILEPDTDLDISIKQLKGIDLVSQQLLYSDNLLANLNFKIDITKKQNEKIKNFINKYLSEFINDNLEIDSATEYYKYSRQKEMLHTTILRFEKNYPIKNLWLNEENISSYGYGEKVCRISCPLENYNFLETIFCLEKENEDERKIKIEELDKEKGIKITDYSEKIPSKIKATQEKRNKTPDQIKEITIIKPHDPDKEHYRVVINEDYKNAKNINRKCWKKLIEVIEDEKEVVAEKAIIDYFNYNKKCKIYYCGKYKLTNILERTKGIFKISPSVKTEIISKSAYKQRLKKT